MIGKLKGLVDGFGDDHVHLDVNGVVYETFCSAKTLAALPQVGHSAVIHTEMIVREDMIRLYGFFTEAENELPCEMSARTSRITIRKHGSSV